MGRWHAGLGTSTGAVGGHLQRLSRHLLAMPSSISAELRAIQKLMRFQFPDRGRRDITSGWPTTRPEPRFRFPERHFFLETEIVGMDCSLFIDAA